MQPFVRGASRSMILFIFALIILTGCRSDNRADEDRARAFPGDAATYQLRGIVVSSDAAKGIVTIDTEAIPGLMGAMTMPYKLAQPGVATELHQGDHVTARLRISTSASVLDQIDVTAQAKPDYKPEKFYNVPSTRADSAEFQIPQSKRQDHYDRAISRQSIAGHLHLHPLSIARLLHPHEPQLRHRPKAAGRRPRAVRQDPFAEHQL